jgi:hypothetical protein
MKGGGGVLLLLGDSAGRIKRKSLTHHPSRLPSSQLLASGQEGHNQPDSLTKQIPLIGQIETIIFPRRNPRGREEGKIRVLTSKKRIFIGIPRWTSGPGKENTTRSDRSRPGPYRRIRDHPVKEYIEKREERREKNLNKSPFSRSRLYTQETKKNKPQLKYKIVVEEEPKEEERSV